MTEQEAGKVILSPQQLEQLWADHLKGEFETKDVEATLATMVDDAYVNHMPVNTGGRGKDALRRFYRDDFIPSWPEDLKMTPVNRVVGEGQLVDELHLTFTHSKSMPWFLPNMPPTQKKIARCRSGRAVSRRQTCLRADLLGSRGRPSTIGPAQGVVTSHIGWVEQSDTHQI